MESQDDTEDEQLPTDPTPDLSWEVRVGKDGYIHLSPEFVGPFLADRLAWERSLRVSRRGAPHAAPADVAPPRPVGSPSGQGGLAPDAYVDQRSGVLDRRMYLRLSREGAFPSKKIGKRVLARWADVQAALAPVTPSTHVGTNGNHDSELDPLRVQLGLSVRGGR